MKLKSIILIATILALVGSLALVAAGDTYAPPKKPDSYKPVDSYGTHQKYCFNKCTHYKSVKGKCVDYEWVSLYNSFKLLLTCHTCIIIYRLVPRRNAASGRLLVKVNVTSIRRFPSVASIARRRRSVLGMDIVNLVQR